MLKGRRRPGRKGWVVIVAGLAGGAFALSRGGGAEGGKDLYLVNSKKCGGEAA